MIIPDFDQLRTTVPRQLFRVGEQDHIIGPTRAFEQSKTMREALPR